MLSCQRIPTPRHAEADQSRAGNGGRRHHRGGGVCDGGGDLVLVGTGRAGRERPSEPGRTRATGAPRVDTAFPPRTLTLCLLRRALVFLVVVISVADGGRIPPRADGSSDRFPHSASLTTDPFVCSGRTPSHAREVTIWQHADDPLSRNAKKSGPGRSNARPKRPGVRRPRTAKRRRPRRQPAWDRDLDGIVAGPQPLTEWQQEGLAAFEAAEEEAEEKAADQNG